MSIIVRKSKFGNYAEDYAKYRAGFPNSFFERILALNFAQPGLKVLDLGTGTGTLARWFSTAGLDVTGLDSDEKMIAASKELDKAAGVEIDYIVASADDVPLGDHSIDLVTAGQCWHWFSRQTIREVLRVLKPSGKLLVAYFDWIGRNGNPVSLMYEMKPNYVLDEECDQKRWPLGFYPQEANDLNFETMELLNFDLWEEEILYSHEAWLGRLRSYSGLSSRLTSEQMKKFILEYGEAARKNFPEKSLKIPHKLWFGLWAPAPRSSSG